MPPKGKARPADVPSNRDFTIRGLNLRNEFMRTRDEATGRETGGAAVILRTVHRVDRGDPETDDLTPEQREKYAAEADRFLRVSTGLANLTWSEEDRDWLNERGLKKLERLDR